MEDFDELDRVMDEDESRREKTRAYLPFSLKALRSSDREKIPSKSLSPLAGCTALFTYVAAITSPVNYLGSLIAPLSILEAMSTLLVSDSFSIMRWRSPRRSKLC
ncbi:hypothetical protein FF1_043670 [Malus domestica]